MGLGAGTGAGPVRGTLDARIEQHAVDEWKACIYGCSVQQEEESAKGAQRDHGRRVSNRREEDRKEEPRKRTTSAGVIRQKDKRWPFQSQKPPVWASSSESTTASTPRTLSSTAMSPR